MSTLVQLERFKLYKEMPHDLVRGLRSFFNGVPSEFRHVSLVATADDTLEVNGLTSSLFRASVLDFVERLELGQNSIGEGDDMVINVIRSPPPTHTHSHTHELASHDLGKHMLFCRQCLPPSPPARRWPLKEPLLHNAGAPQPDGSGASSSPSGMSDVAARPPVGRDISEMPQSLADNLPDWVGYGFLYLVSIAPVLIAGTVVAILFFNSLR